MRTPKALLFVVLAVAAALAAVPTSAHAEAVLVSHTPAAYVFHGDEAVWHPETVMVREGPFVRTYHVCRLMAEAGGASEVLFGDFTDGRCYLFGWQNEDGSISMGGEITHGWSSDIEYAEYVSLQIVAAVARAAY